MNKHFNSTRPPRRSATARTLSPFIALLCAVWLIGSSVAHGALISVGQPEVIYKAGQRRDLGLGSWVDGSLGVVPIGNGQYDFYGANSTTPVRTTGTLENPGQAKKKVSINGLPGGTFNYVAGGPMYTDPASGSRLMLYHAERHGASNRDYYTVLGMAVSTDAQGLQFQDLGVVVEAAVPMELRPHSIDLGGGSLTVVGDQLHIYYRDFFPDASRSELAVARASLSDVVSNALSGQGTAFTKYYNGGWTESALGGRSSPLEAGNPGNTWSAVAYNNYLNGLVMVSSQWEGGGGDLYLSTSGDGINWTPRQAIALDPGEQLYPSLIGTGPDPTKTDQSFYVYYTDSAAGGWDRWNDARLVRRQIMFDPPPPPPPPPPAPGWTRVASYRDEFQPSGPAAGWKYQWSASGKLGDSSKYAPLYWSDAVGVYSTTGGPPQAPNPKTHPDDYLFLGAGAGHPGRSNYYAITGYTIQAEDGAGLYRLVNSSIMKSDGTKAKNEDGLDVLVYVNNQKIGSTLSAPVSGAAINFNRDLGSLSIGDTVYVMIGAGKNNDYDMFVGFDYALEKFIVSSSPPPPPLPPPPPPPPANFVWTAVSDYRDDFQAGGPAPGWNYLWSAEGKIGKGASYAPLLWSDIAGAYNTTGGATQAYAGKSHVDDYLSLGPDGGHPGRSKYYAITSYTIQADDGAGLYRLLTSSIMKNDAVKTKSEDGLDVLVFVNTQQIGPTTSVSTNGQFSWFDRELGTLNVGDTIYVMVGSGKNNDYDSFVNFDFTIEKWMPVESLATAAAAGVQAVPEPGSAVLLVAVVPAALLVRRCRKRNQQRRTTRVASMLRRRG